MPVLSKRMNSELNTLNSPSILYPTLLKFGLIFSTLKVRKLEFVIVKLADETP